MSTESFDPFASAPLAPGEDVCVSCNRITRDCAEVAVSWLEKRSALSTTTVRKRGTVTRCAACRARLDPASDRSVKRP